jgi:hypothetical protein
MPLRYGCAARGRYAACGASSAQRAPLASLVATCSCTGNAGAKVGQSEICMNTPRLSNSGPRFPPRFGDCASPVPSRPVAPRRPPVLRREQLRNELLATVDSLQHRRADQISEGFTDAISDELNSPAGRRCSARAGRLNFCFPFSNQPFRAAGWSVEDPRQGLRPASSPAS